MNTKWIDILNVIINVVFMHLSVRIFFSAFAEKRKEKWFLFSLIPSALFAFTLLFVKIVPLKTSLLFVSVVGMSYIFRFAFKNRLLMSALFIGISAAAEAITAAGIMSVFTLDIKGAETGIYDVAGTVISKIIALCVIFMIRQARHSMLFGKFKAKQLFIYALPIATVMLVTFQYYVWHFLDNAFVNAIGFVSMLLLVLSNLYIFEILDGIYQSLQNEIKLEMANALVIQQKKQYDMLFSRDEEVRKMRHDYKNFLIGLTAELKNGNSGDAEKAAKSELERIEKLSENAITGDSVIDTVINYKKAEAEQKGISFEFNYRNLHDIKVSGVDMALLLGNAIDNAVEATEKVNAGDKLIKISVILKGSILSVSVTNPVDGKIDVNNIKTTKKDKKMHGFGIENMKMIAEKYNGEIITECENGLFNLTAVINNFANE